MVRSLLPVSRWHQPAARRASAFWAVAAFGAVMVTVLAVRSHSPFTPSTVLRIFPTAATHIGQHRWVPFSTTVVSARAAPARTSSRPRLIDPRKQDRIICLPLAYDGQRIGGPAEPALPFAPAGRRA